MNPMGSLMKNLWLNGMVQPIQIIGSMLHRYSKENFDINSNLLIVEGVEVIQSPVMIIQPLMTGTRKANIILIGGAVI